MKLVALAGLNRPGNLTSIALAALGRELGAAGFDVEAPDSASVVLPFPGHPPTDSSRALKDSVTKADAIVLATPEYHGGYSAFLKLMIENLGFPSVLRAKPVALLGVAAGKIGAIKSLEQLRSVVSHTGGIVMPGALSIAGVRGAFNEEGAPDAATTKALHRFAIDFFEFAGSWLDDADDPLPLEDAVREAAPPWTTRI